jgi:hypothetical protein
MEIGKRPCRDRDGADCKDDSDKEGENKSLVGVNEIFRRDKQCNRKAKHHGNNGTEHSEFYGVDSVSPGTGEVNFKARLEEEEKDAEPGDGFEHILLDNIRGENGIVQMGEKEAQDCWSEQNTDEQFGSKGRLMNKAKEFAKAPGQDEQDEHLHEKYENVMFTEKMHYNYLYSKR